MRRDRRYDQIVSLPTRHKLLDVSHAFSVRLIVSDRKVDDGFTENTTNTRFCSLIRDRVLEVIHVTVGRRPTANHFSQTETSADTHKLFRDVLRFSRKDVLRQPLLQIEIIRETTKQDHRHMRVAINQTGCNDLARRVDLLT